MKKFIAAITAALLLCLGLTAPAWAADEPCVPRDAWTETIPAVGEPTLPNPDYKPAWTEDVKHDAEYKTVHHEAVTHVEYLFKHDKKDKTRWEENPNWNANNNENSLGWYNTGETRTVEDKAAFDEQVLVKDAWTEKIEHDAVGEETVPNKDYVPERTVEYPAVVCDVDPNVPTKPQPPAEVEGPNQVDVEYACDGVTIAAYTMRTTTTPYRWNADEQDWVLDFDAATNDDKRTTVDTGPVDCGGPTDPTPEPETETNVVDREFACDGTTVTAYTEQTITTPYRWDEELQDWDLDFDAQTTTENRVVVDDVDVDCSVDTPTEPTKGSPNPTEPHPASAPVSAPPKAVDTPTTGIVSGTPYYPQSTYRALPQTGVDLGPVAGVGALLAIFGAALMFFSRKRRG